MTTVSGSRYPGWFGLASSGRVASPQPPFLGGPLPGYAAALSGLSDAELHRLLERRPDLLSSPAPASFPELAGRAGTPASLAAALRALDLGTLRLAELLAVLGLPTTVPALAAAAGPGLDPKRLEDGLATLAELGVALPGPDGTISGPPGLGAPFGRPGGLGPPVAELAKVGVSAERLERILANLGAPRPAGTGKAALVRAVSAALADPEVVARAATEADPDARRLLEEALAAPGPITVMGVGYGRFAGYPDAEPASWLLERGLLLPVTYSQLVVPREAALGLRGGLVFPTWPEPPVAETLDPLPDGPARAAAAATRAVVAAEGVCARLDRDPLPLVRAGTVAVRDLGRLARDRDLSDEELALLIDLLVEAGILAVGGPFGQRSLGLRPEADAWLSGPRSRRWAGLVTAWRSADLAVEDHLVIPAPGARAAPPPDRARPLAGRRLAAAAARRRALLELLASSPGAPAVGGLAPLLAWRQPMVWPDPAGAGPDDLEATVRAVLDAAAFLGLAVVGSGRAQAGLATQEWLAGPGPAGPAADRPAGPAREGSRDVDDPAGPARERPRDVDGPAEPAGEGPRDPDDPADLPEDRRRDPDGLTGLAGVVAEALPDGPDRFLLAGDLTVVAPGGLAPGVETRLAGLADREAAGSGTWRIHDASLRRAFDEGRTAEEVLEFLRRHSSTPLPQALEYLVADVARRHGRLRVGGATTYLRGDPATVAGAVRSAAGRRLGLRELAPGVAVTGRSQRELLAALRKSGETPLAEEADGTPRPEGSRPVRHVQRAAPDRLGRAAAAANGHAADRRPELDPAAAVARLRGRRPTGPLRPEPQRQPAPGDHGAPPGADRDGLPGTDRRAARG
jgi:hypothetical protein